MGKVYGARRAAILQGYPPAADLPFDKKKLTRAIAEAVHYQVALAWAKAVRESIKARQAVQ